MQEEVKSANSAELQPGDIIFECPQCGKSLAIDVRGAGYIVRCPDCHTEIQVPGVDAPSEEEDDEVEIPPAPGSEISLEARVQHLERLRAADAERFGQISGELSLIQAALDRLVGLVEDAQASEPSDSAS